MIRGSYNPGMVVSKEQELVSGLESGKIFDFPWFVFTAELWVEDSNGEFFIHNVEVRIIYDPELKLSSTPIGPEEAQELFRWSLGATDGHSAIFNSTSKQPLKEMFNRQVESEVPLTILIAHGGANLRGESIILGRNVVPFENYRRRIEDMDRKLRDERGIKTAEPSVILMAVCGSSDPYYKIPDRDSSIVYYRNGRVGLVRQSGEFRSSRMEG